MTTTKSLTALATFAVLLGSAGGALADPYADTPFSLQRVTTGTALDGSLLSTSSDDGDNGRDATGAPDVIFNEPYRQTVLGYDAATGQGGVIELDFADNLCLDGAGSDLLFYDVASNEHVLVEVSNDGGNTYYVAGEAGPTTNFRVDVGGQLDYFNRMRVTATDYAGTNTQAGFDLDAVECLTSVPEEQFTSVDDGCDFMKSGREALDVRAITAFSDGFSISVNMELCADVVAKKKGPLSQYVVHFDTLSPTVLEGNASCTDTTDHVASYRQDGLETGGIFFLDGASLSAEVDYVDLGIASGDQVLVWVETFANGPSKDHVPNVEGGDRCDLPQTAREVMTLTLR
jgi:hypothetical protein